MNIIKMRQEKKAKQIGEIIASIEKAKEKGVEITFKKVVLATMANLNLSRRTAREYVEIAWFKLGLENGK